MNELFSFRRFGRLFVKHTVEHYRTYLMATGILVGFLVLTGSFLFFLIPALPDINFQLASYVIVMFVAGGLFTSSIFADYGDKNRAIPALTLPATSLEKFLVGWLWSFPIFLVVYTAVFYLAVWGLSSIRLSGGKQGFAIFSFVQPQVSVMLVLFTEVHALALFGAIFFRKLPFIRTGFSFFVALAMTMLLNTIFLKVLTGVRVIKPALPFGNLNFYQGDKFYTVETGDKADWFIQGLVLIAALLTWAASYYRLKEKRV
ncbi:MAG TPA: hypothetical protein VL978_09905 [Puia sp.]|nr:hypothetical protein [Puia sp.]